MTIARQPAILTAEEFVETDQSVFGPAWRYELVDGVIEAHAAPSQAHGTILTNLGFALKGRLRNHHESCHAEIGSAVIPVTKARHTARIPDALVRCKGLPRVTFEIVSPSELRHIKARDRKREDVKSVEGVCEIIEIYQHTMAAHIHSKNESGAWELVPISEEDAILEIRSLGIAIPLRDLYQDAIPADAS